MARIDGQGQQKDGNGVEGEGEQAQSKVLHRSGEDKKAGGQRPKRSEAVRGKQNAVGQAQKGKPGQHRYRMRKRRAQRGEGALSH